MQTRKAGVRLRALRCLRSNNQTLAREYNAALQHASIESCYEGVNRYSILQFLRLVREVDSVSISRDATTRSWKSLTDKALPLHWYCTFVQSFEKERLEDVRRSCIECSSMAGSFIIENWMLLVDSQAFSYHRQFIAWYEGFVWQFGCAFNSIAIRRWGSNVIQTTPDSTYTACMTSALVSRNF